MQFSEMNLSGETLSALSKLGYDNPTEVQEKAVPEIITGHNLIVRSHTGTGKTAAFGIGIIERLAMGSSKKALIMAPTRELAVQVCKELRGISEMHGMKVHVVYGGQSINIQIQNLENGVDILVATPGRLLDLYRRRIVDISKFDAIVLDEADHMLDLGFQDEVTEILDKLPAERIMLLLSATIDESILRMASKYLPKSKTIEIGEIEVVSTVEEEYLETTHREKFARLMDVLRNHREVKTLIFLETKMGASRIQERLLQRGIRGVGVLQGDLSQARRNAVLQDFRGGKVTILVATNVAARGLHIEDLDLIINYDEAKDEETHLHRVGRTGRMGEKGKVINFIPRKETLNERMSEDHPDFAWMKEGYHRDSPRRDERPQRRDFSRRPIKKGNRARGPGHSYRTSSR